MESEYISHIDVGPRGLSRSNLEDVGGDTGPRPTEVPWCTSSLLAGGGLRHDSRSGRGWEGDHSHLSYERAEHVTGGQNGERYRNSGT